MKNIRRVSFLGFSGAKNGDEAYEAAKKSAYLLAKNGFTIVNGGGPGIMRASTEGAQEAGGKTIGVTFNPEGMANFEGQDPKNKVDELIEMPNYLERTYKLLELGDVYVFFNGGTGTVSEFGMAWGLARLFFGKHKPLILFGEWWHDIMESFGRNMEIRPEALQVYEIVTTPERLLEEILEIDRGED